MTRADPADAAPLRGQGAAPPPRAFEIRRPSPEDHEAYCAFAARLDREDLRLRFAGLVKIDCAALRAQLIAIDNAQSEALAIFSGAEMLAIAHLVRTAPAVAEFALIVRSDLKRQGLGRLLLARLLTHACRLGLRRLTGQILSENLPMLRLARQAGFRAMGRSGFLVDMAKDLSCNEETDAAPYAA
jgi:acetyltransferase